MTDSAWQRRIKRHVIAKSHDFFAIVSPGLAPICAQELRQIVSNPASVTIISGGVMFRGRLTDGYLANLHLRFAGRVLMRLARIQATHFAILQNRISHIPWNLYLPPNCALDIRVTVHRCKLMHSQAIAQSVRAGIEAQMRPSPSVAHPPQSQAVYIRGLNDRFTLSLDSSGDNLYRRGAKTHGGRAPLRETLAAAILHLAGYQPGQYLVDPMCGSGTFSLEAALITTRMPPGWFREFAFFNWPAFRANHWHYLKRKCQKQIHIPDQTIIWASDFQSAAIRRLRWTVSKLAFEKCIQVDQRDFFKLTPPAKAAPPGVVVLNPPYGRRLTDGMNRKIFYDRIGAKLKADFNGWRYAVIAPSLTAAKALGLAGKAFQLSHGGLRIELRVGEI